MISRIRRTSSPSLHRLSPSVHQPGAGIPGHMPDCACNGGRESDDALKSSNSHDGKSRKEERPKANQKNEKYSKTSPDF